ncbi:hypothetical protein EXD76_02260 [BEV proteobacterium]|nr:hypothetical protein [Candidatus Symbiopectobacterium sp. Chty_BC]
MKRRILTVQNHAVRLHEKTVHLRGQAFSIKTGLAKQYDSLLFNKALLRIWLSSIFTDLLPTIAAALLWNPGTSATSPCPDRRRNS